MEAFLASLDAMPVGYSIFLYDGNRWGVTVEHLADGRQTKLYGEELGGKDHVSFNLYRPRSGKVLLKPCEMPDEKVVAFVLGARLSDHSTIS